MSSKGRSSGVAGVQELQNGTTDPKVVTLCGHRDEIAEAGCSALNTQTPSLDSSEPLVTTVDPKRRGQVKWSNIGQATLKSGDRSNLKQSNSKIGTDQISCENSNFRYTFIICCIYCLLVMRFPRIKPDTHSFYHCISRVVEGRFIFAIALPSGITASTAATAPCGLSASRVFCSKVARRWRRLPLTSI
jgi:hypothetical protein